MTGTSDLHGMQIDADLTSPAQGVFKNVDMHAFVNTHYGCTPKWTPDNYMWWLTKGSACTTYPITLINDYADEPSEISAAIRSGRTPRIRAVGLPTRTAAGPFPVRARRVESRMAHLRAASSFRSASRELAMSAPVTCPQRKPPRPADRGLSAEAPPERTRSQK
jgi:hypothetical protein